MFCRDEKILSSTFLIGILLLPIVLLFRFLIVSYYNEITGKKIRTGIILSFQLFGDDEPKGKSNIDSILHKKSAMSAASDYKNLSAKNTPSPDGTKKLSKYF